MNLVSTVLKQNFVAFSEWIRYSNLKIENIENQTVQLSTLFTAWQNLRSTGTSRIYQTAIAHSTKSLASVLFLKEILF